MLKTISYHLVWKRELCLSSYTTENARKVSAACHSHAAGGICCITVIARAPGGLWATNELVRPSVVFPRVWWGGNAWERRSSTTPLSIPNIRSLFWPVVIFEVSSATNVTWRYSRLCVIIVNIDKNSAAWYTAAFVWALIPKDNLELTSHRVARKCILLLMEVVWIIF